MYSILVASRKDSPFLERFLRSYEKNTTDPDNAELLLMYNVGETKNLAVIKEFQDKGLLKSFTEDWGLGRSGLHKYFNLLLTAATGEWVWYLCEDHDFIRPWDSYINEFLEKKKVNPATEIDPQKVNCLVPLYNNIGAVSHILSRGWLNVTGRLAGHGNLDSWIGTIASSIQHHGRVHQLLLTGSSEVDAMMTDYTHNKEEIEAVKDQMVSVTPPGVIPWSDPGVQDALLKELEAIREAIRTGK